MEEALLAGHTELAEFLAPMCTLEEEKTYTTAKTLEEVNEEEEKIEEELGEVETEQKVPHKTHKDSPTQEQQNVADQQE